MICQSIMKQQHFILLKLFKQIYLKLWFKFHHVLDDVFDCVSGYTSISINMSGLYEFKIGFDRMSWILDTVLRSWINTESSW